MEVSLHGLGGGGGSEPAVNNREAEWRIKQWRLAEKTHPRCLAFP